MPLLGFRGRLAERTVDTVRRVLDDDEDFRQRVLASLDNVDGDADPVSDLLLRRPPGWQDAWRTVLEATETEDRRRREARAELDAARREEAAAARIVRQVEELDTLRTELAEARAALESERSSRQDASQRVGSLEAELRSVRAERDRAVSELAESRRAFADLHEELRAVRRGADPQAVADRERRLAAVAELRTELGGVLSELAGVEEDLLALADDLGAAAAEPAAGSGTGPAPGGTGGPGGPTGAPVGGSQPSPQPSPQPSAQPSPQPAGRAAVPSRRRPLRLRRGVLEGSPQAVDQLLRAAGVTVLVDGYNLGMTVWRTLEPAALRERTVGFLTDVSTRTGAEVTVVFDGGEVGQRLAVSSPLGVRTLFSPTGVEADDVLIELVADHPVERPVVVVSSDRRVRDGVRRRGANVVRSEELWGWATESPRG